MIRYDRCVNTCLGNVDEGYIIWSKKISQDMKEFPSTHPTDRTRYDERFEGIMRKSGGFSFRRLIKDIGTGHSGDFLFLK